MSLKRIIPILLLLTLAISLAACQSDTKEEAVGATTDNYVAEAAEPVEVEKNVPADSEDGQKVDHDDDAPSDVVESEEEADHHDAEAPEGEHPAANTPGFVPPRPATLATGSEAVAFAMGDPDAPVQIVEFTDYQCPFCQRYALETMPAMVENLVDSGRVFYAIKDLPLDAIHSEARAASVAARCAGEQDAYLEMHDAIFEAQSQWSGSGNEAEGIFADLAAALELDADAFSTCMADGSQAAMVQANVQEAMSLGISGTPVFFIDGYGVTGAQPFEMFEMAVQLAENDELDDVIEAQSRAAYEAAMAQQSAAQAPPEPPVLVEVSLDDAYAIGEPDAPVTIVEYTDFQCPFCARHALETFTQIEEDLVETGKVRYVFKDLPLTSIHPQAMLASEAARCAGAQDTGPEAYVAMHQALFENQEAWSGQANAGDLFASYAAEIGLDSNSLAACLESHDFKAAVVADMQEAASFGINGTPAFVVNGYVVSGALPFEVFEGAVESLIAEASAETASN